MALRYAPVYAKVHYMYIRRGAGAVGCDLASRNRPRAEAVREHEVRRGARRQPAEDMGERHGVLGRCVKHLIHILDAAHIPCRDIPVKGVGVAEHPVHVCDTAYIPRRDIAVETFSAAKHPVHVLDALHIPR